MSTVAQTKAHDSSIHDARRQERGERRCGLFLPLICRYLHHSLQFELQKGRETLQIHLPARFVEIPDRYEETEDQSLSIIRAKAWVTHISPL